MQVWQPRSTRQTSCTAALNCFPALVAPSIVAGLLNSLTSTFTDLGLDVVRAEIGGKGGTFRDTFWVTTMERTKVSRQACEQVAERAT